MPSVGQRPEDALEDAATGAGVLVARDANVLSLSSSGWRVSYPCWSLNLYVVQGIMVSGIEVLTNMDSSNDEVVVDGELCHVVVISM